MRFCFRLHVSVLLVLQGAGLDLTLPRHSGHAGHGAPTPLKPSSTGSFWVVSTTRNSTSDSSWANRPSSGTRRTAWYFPKLTLVMVTCGSLMRCARCAMASMVIIYFCYGLRRTTKLPGFICRKEQKQGALGRGSTNRVFHWADRSRYKIRFWPELMLVRHRSNVRSSREY